MGITDIHYTHAHTAWWCVDITLLKFREHILLLNIYKHSHKVAVLCDVQDNWSALHMAAAQGHVEIVELLLKKGCDVNVFGGPVCQ